MRPGRKKRQSMEDVVCKPRNPWQQLELLSRGFTPHSGTLSSTHLLFPPQKRRFTLQIPTPIGESCSLVHILALLFAARTQDSRKKNNPRHREIQKLARQKWVQCAVPKTTGRCEISKAEFIECFTLPTRDPRFKPQHQEKASE